MQLVGLYYSHCTHILMSLDVLVLQNLIPSYPFSSENELFTCTEDLIVRALLSFVLKFCLVSLCEFWERQGRLKVEESQNSFMFRPKNHTLFALFSSGTSLHPVSKGHQLSLVGR